MTHRRPDTRTYVRPMAGWWRRNPHFQRYMLREASAVFVVVYALVLLVGLLRLAQGEAAFEAWRAALGTPLSFLWHLTALPMVAYHSLTWFQVMPKTMPRLPVRPGWITACGITLSVALSAALVAGIRWASP